MITYVQRVSHLSHSYNIHALVSSPRHSSDVYLMKKWQTRSRIDVQVIHASYFMSHGSPRMTSIFSWKSSTMKSGSHCTFLHCHICFCCKAHVILVRRISRSTNLSLKSPIECCQIKLFAGQQSTRAWSDMSLVFSIVKFKAIIYHQGQYYTMTVGWD